LASRSASLWRGIVDLAGCFSAGLAIGPLIHVRRINTTGNSLVNRGISASAALGHRWCPVAHHAQSVRPPGPAASESSARSATTPSPSSARAASPTQPAATQPPISDDGRIMHQTGALDQLGRLDVRLPG
jgi:hypothetical protein